MTVEQLRQEAMDNPAPTLNLLHPDHVVDFVHLTCFRGRKFGRARFARLIQDRVSSPEFAERFVTHVPVEMIALFFAREVRPVSEEQAPANECFELPDGGLLEFVGDHMEAAEVIARLMLHHDEARLEHVVQLMTEHSRSWLHTLALETRDARLLELGFPDLDDAERLFIPWHAQLLIRRLEAWGETTTAAKIRLAPSKVSAEAILQFVHDLPEPSRQLALGRLHYLAICQAIFDTKRYTRRMTPDGLHTSAAVALGIIAQGIREADGDISLVDGPQVATVYRLGLASLA
jgi:hypothetical protein